MFTFESDSQNLDSRIDSFLVFGFIDTKKGTEFLSLNTYAWRDLFNPISTAYKVEMNNLTRNVVYRSWLTVQTLVFRASTTQGTLGPAWF